MVHHVSMCILIARIHSISNELFFYNRTIAHKSIIVALAAIFSAIHPIHTKDLHFQENNLNESTFFGNHYTYRQKCDGSSSIVRNSIYVHIVG